MKIYLAIPYSQHEEESFDVANRIAAQLMLSGHIVFSPISMNHCIAFENGLPKGWEFWEKFDKSFIEWCDCLMIVEMKTNGTLRIKQSVGVQDEIRLAYKLGKKIEFIKEN